VFGQLGTPLCIKPLSPPDSLQLLTRPLAYLGFMIEGGKLEHLLVNTNFYPGIIHYVGFSLVNNLTSRFLGVLGKDIDAIENAIRQAEEQSS
jgi:hypothetical protein